MNIKANWNPRLIAIFWVLGLQVSLAANAGEPPDFPRPSFRSATYNIRDFGAVGDGKTIDTLAINQAIERCAAEGGGEVVFPTGVYVTTSIHLRSHVRLVVQPKAVIQGAESGYDVPEPNPYDRYQDFGHSHFHNALIWGVKVEDCAIVGGGEINGKHLANFDPQKPDVADKMIAIVSGKNIQFENLTLKNGGHFTWLLNDCENVTIADITLKGSRDAIDLMGCRNVQVHGCKFTACLDDTLGIKSDWALGRKIETRNVYVWNCDFDSGCNALQFGSETAGDFHNINIWDIRIQRAEKAGIGITSNDGGDIDGVTYRNITMSGVANPVFILVTDRLRSGDPAKRTGTIRNIHISGVTVANCRPSLHHGAVNPITISGRPESFLQKITLENIRVNYPGGGRAGLTNTAPGYSKEYAPGKYGDRPASGLYARNIDGLTLRNVAFTFASQDERSPLVLSDVKGLTIDDLQSPRTTGVPLLKLERVLDCTICNTTGVASRQGTTIDRLSE